MGVTTDISWVKLSLGYILMLIPITILWYYQTKLVKGLLVAIVRMSVQLFLVGLYLEYIFVLNLAWVNALWVVVMILIASFTISNKSSLNRKYFVFPIFISLLVSIFIVEAFFLDFIIELDNAFDARYLIPISGMVIGNCMRNNIIALNTYYNKLSSNITLYRYSIINGASKTEALLPYMKEALRLAINPAIAVMSVMGLISLPGMMTGQILGGSNPNLAIKYQILITISIYITAILSIFLSIVISNKFVFDGFHNLKKGIVKKSS